MLYNVNLRENLLCQPIVGKRGESCRCCCHLRELCELWCLQINLFKVISFKTIFWLIDSFLAPQFGFYNLIRSLSPFFSLQRPGPFLLSWQLCPSWWWKWRVAWWPGSDDRRGKVYGRYNCEYFPFQRWSRSKFDEISQFNFVKWWKPDSSIWEYWRGFIWIVTP